MGDPPICHIVRRTRPDSNLMFGESQVNWSRRYDSPPRYVFSPVWDPLGLAEGGYDALGVDALDQGKIVRQARMHIPPLEQRTAVLHETSACRSGGKVARKQDG